MEGAGEAAGEIYLADRGFSGRSWERHWNHSYGARIITPRNASQHFASPRELNRRRQIVETVFGILCDTFRLKFPRARTIEGLEARIACKIAALNAGILINRMYGRNKFEIFNPIA
ncbi:MAG: transposase [Chloroflexi bacterium]|nr:transposase [Chloroflexota bacterium]